MKEIESVSRSVMPNCATVAHQAPLSKGFLRQEYWRGFPFPSPEDLPNPGIKPRSPALQAVSLLSEPPGKPESGDWEILSGVSMVHFKQEQYFACDCSQNVFLQ